MHQFRGKVVWITGASSGIGEALAKKFNSIGSRVIISARREEELKRVKSECDDSSGVKILPIDLEQHSNSGEWATEAWELFGGIDLLINNGGIGQFGSALDCSDDVERRIFEINYFGNIALTKSILPRMLEAGSGHIVAIASIAAKFGQAKLAAYSASKAALLIYFESLKEEMVGSPVKIQAVSPGFIKTNVTINSLKPDGSKMMKNSPAQENGMPTDIFAKKFVKAISKDKFHQYIGNKELLAVPVHSIVPGLFYKMLRKGG